MLRMKLDMHPGGSDSSATVLIYTDCPFLLGGGLPKKQKKKSNS